MQARSCTFVFTLLVTCAVACASDPRAQPTLLQGESSGSAADANGAGAASCGNGNAASNGNATANGNNTGRTLTTADYQYAFFLRDDWGTPNGLNESDLYIVISDNPNFCVNGILTGVDHDIPTLSIEHAYTVDANQGPVIITPGGYQADVVLDTHPINGGSNGPDRVCDFYDHGGIVDNAGDTFGASALGTFTLQSYSATTLDFTIDAIMPAYTVPAGRSEPPVFSGQTVHYTLQATVCAFPPEDESHGAPNGFDGAPTAACPGMNN